MNSSEHAGTSPLEREALRALCRRHMSFADGREASYFSLPAAEQLGLGAVSRLPVCLRLVLESLIRNCDGLRVTEGHVRQLAAWTPRGERTAEVPFLVARVALNDTAGIPVLGDLAAMRSAAHRAGLPAQRIGPAVPIDMVMDHSLVVDHHASPDALLRNMQLEVKRNEERFSFVKWAIQGFRGIRAIPPGFGILHQVNIEYLARLLMFDGGTCFPDSLVGPDSHTGMIAGLGVVGWGVGGIEANTAILGQPVYFLSPDVVGVHVVGELAAGVTVTDLVLYVTQQLRRAGVTGKFVEFFGAGAARLSIPDRVTLANMSPEYGARIGYFPVDEATCRYLLQTGRKPQHVAAIERYFKAQGCFGMPEPDAVDYTDVLTLDLSQVSAAVAGPKRPQDRIALPDLKREFAAILEKPEAAGGYGKRYGGARALRNAGAVAHGDIVIAAITSCANTSNPGVMLTAGIVAKKAVMKGLAAKPWVKTSLAPGSAVVGEYLQAAGLQQYLDALGFAVVGYGCATCVGNSGPIEPALEDSIRSADVIACAVLSGNRNFEGRTHPAVRATYLMSPPLVVAFALTGTMDFDVERDALGRTAQGEPVYLRDLWPTAGELADALRLADRQEHYRALYDVDYARANPLWNAIPEVPGEVYPWHPASTYFREPPYFTDRGLTASSLAPVSGARALVVVGDTVTTDHISPISDIDPASPAGLYLQQQGIARADFNSYGARRMNHEVMLRGVFANPRLRNLMQPAAAAGMTRHWPGGEAMSIYDAAMRYKQDDVPLIVIAGDEYGFGSARDWAAKGPRLLGVRAVIAAGFERIHRSNLVGMGVLPCQWDAGASAAALGIDGSETFEITGLDENAGPRQKLQFVARATDGRRTTAGLTLRVDTEQEMKYLKCGGILQYVLSRIRGESAVASG